MIKESKKLIVIVGPNASGKSDLAVELAKRFDGEVVSADSRKVYIGMDIGTGKITKKEMHGIPHHLIDVASPKRRFTVAQYQKRALEAIKKIQKKNKIPVLCGGTGFYIQAVVDGIVIPKVKPNWKLRKKLEKKSCEDLFKKLKKLDPRRARKIDRHNKRRLIRAIEIITKSKKSVPPLQKKERFNVLIIGIKREREELKRRIRARLLRWLKKGLVREVKGLKESGLSWKRLEDFGLEYRFVAQYLQGKLNYNEMVEITQRAIENYAKRQMTWFKKDNRIHWISNQKEAERLVREFLKK